MGNDAEFKWALNKRKLKRHKFFGEARHYLAATRRAQMEDSIEIYLFAFSIFSFQFT